MTEPNTIILKPTFRGTVGILRALIENGTKVGQHAAWEEIDRWAAMLDNMAAAEARAASDQKEEPELCDECSNAPAKITVERAFIKEGEAPTAKLCKDCYAKVEFS